MSLKKKVPSEATQKLKGTIPPSQERVDWTSIYILQIQPSSPPFYYHYFQLCITKIQHPLSYSSSDYSPLRARRGLWGYESQGVHKVLGKPMTRPCSQIYGYLPQEILLQCRGCWNTRGPDGPTLICTFAAQNYPRSGKFLQGASSSCTLQDNCPSC